MKFKTYKVKQGQYGGVINSTITIPDGLKLITGGKNDIGPMLNTGNFHYLGIMEGNKEDMYPNLKGLHVYSKQCGKYVIITIEDVSFIEPYPYLTTADELNKEFDLSKYFFVTWSQNLKLINMKKIVKINSEFNIEVLKVTNRDYFGVGNLYMLRIDREELDTILDGCFSLSDNSPLATKVVEGEIANDYWLTLINNTTGKFGINIPVQSVDIDFPNKLFTNIKHGYDLTDANKWKEIDEYLKMTKVKYLND